MTFQRTLGFAVHSIFIGTLVTAPSFTEAPYGMLLILSLVSGFSLISFFAPAKLEERYEVVSFVFILASIIQIILGALAKIFGLLPRNNLLELGILFLGLFCPIFIFGQILGEKVSIKPVIWNLVSVGLVYCLVTSVVLLSGAIA